MLKWTYGYGFYNLEREEDAVKKRFFEFIQADAEMTLERLTETVETELAEYFHEEKSPNEFADFRGKLAGLTAVTCKYFDTLVRELEEGLPGVGIVDDTAAATAATTAAATPATKENGKGPPVDGGVVNGSSSGGAILGRIASGIRDRIGGGGSGGGGGKP